MNCYPLLGFLNDFASADFVSQCSTITHRIPSASVGLFSPLTGDDLLFQPLTTQFRSLARLVLSAPPAIVSASLDLSWVASSCCIIQQKSRSSILWTGAYSLWSLYARSLRLSRPLIRALWTFCRTFISNLVGFLTFCNWRCKMSGSENSNAYRNYN